MNTITQRMQNLGNGLENLRNKSVEKLSPTLEKIGNTLEKTVQKRDTKITQTGKNVMKSAQNIQNQMQNAIYSAHEETTSQSSDLVTSSQPPTETKPISQLPPQPQNKNIESLPGISVPYDTLIQSANANLSGKQSMYTDRLQLTDEKGNNENNSSAS